MSTGVTAVVEGVMALALGVAVPWLFVRMVVPSLRTSSGAAATNYRGVQVFGGIGFVWLVWAGAAIIGGIAAASLVRTTTVAVLTVAGPLALAAFALGLFDDAYGSSAARGFRGHLRALRGGRLTTGGVKLVGISTACFFVALALADVTPWGSETSGVLRVALALAGGASMALTSNFINLTDLRPGRALKAYSLLAILGVACTALLLGSTAPDAVEPLSASRRMLDAVVLLLFALGPVLAVWRYDLREEGMLGDAGANPMGAVAGLLIVAGLPLWGLVAYLGLMFALNLASERVSFSRVIERNALLRRIDLLGRLPETQAPEPKSGQQSETNPE